MLIVQGQPVQNASKDYVLDDGQATQDWLLPAAMEALTDMLELDGGIPEESKSVIENACMMSRWCLLGNAEKLRRRQAEQPSVLKQRIVDLAGRLLVAALRIAPAELGGMGGPVNHFFLSPSLRRPPAVFRIAEPPDPFCAGFWMTCLKWAMARFKPFKPQAPQGPPF